MIDRKTVEMELAQARSVRIAAELAGCEIEELADNLRQTNASWRAPLAPRGSHRLVLPT